MNKGIEIKKKNKKSRKTTTNETLKTSETAKEKGVI